MHDPILIEVTRGQLVESWHRGAVAVAAPSGALALRLGDVERPVYPRSAVKALQALPLIETGTADRFGFGPAVPTATWTVEGGRGRVPGTPRPDAIRFMVVYCPKYALARS